MCVILSFYLRFFNDDSLWVFSCSFNSDHVRVSSTEEISISISVSNCQIQENVVRKHTHRYTQVYGIFPSLPSAIAPMGWGFTTFPTKNSQRHRSLSFILLLSFCGVYCEQETSVPWLLPLRQRLPSLGRSAQGKGTKYSHIEQYKNIKSI